MLRNKRMLKTTAVMLMSIMVGQMIYPLTALALTTGPSQPEVQAFEPVGTSDMVDLFSGDFVYNIPLLDVDGYPVNISYHGGVDMEQEASWVGLGWNINPGTIIRNVRGLPDDFKGETIGKTLSIKPEKNFRIGVQAGFEPIGISPPAIDATLSFGTSLNFSNYRGVSMDLTAAASINVMGMASAGINVGIGSQSGADINYDGGVRFNTSKILGEDVAGTVGVGLSGGYNTRTGLKDLNISASINTSYVTAENSNGESHVANVNGPTFNMMIPIGLKNIVPVITNQTKMTTVRGQIKFGGELFWSLAYISTYGMLSNLSYSTDGSRAGYGYLYADQKPDKSSIMDFTRDKDGMFNKSMKYLPPAVMTYDVFSISGQGTGGSFRAFRNDIGSVYDPVVESSQKDHSVSIEAGLGAYFEVGADYTTSATDISSGPWSNYVKDFVPKQKGSLYENVYFKQAGELAEVNQAYFQTINGDAPLNPGAILALPATIPGSNQKRVPRSNLISYLTGDEAAISGVGVSGTSIVSYNNTNGFATGAGISKTNISRNDNASGHHGNYLSEITQTQADGKRYVYGIPAMNLSQKEETFSVDPATGDLYNKGLVTIGSGDNSTSNSKGIDHFYSATTTPAYAHSYLLTDVLSADYVDVTGNGVTDDDFGSYTKFNYTRKDAAYQWRAPVVGGTQYAQYNPGYMSDKKDDKANVVSGTRENWMLHSIETKNYVAEFYTSVRADGQGVGGVGNSYKLDSITLYNKHDRFINKTAATPVKTVIFNYDYSLCKGISNTSNAAPNNGKLTLKRIYVRYGKSDRSMISPYVFNYDSQYNYNYEQGNRDRWGSYKPSNNSFPNFLNPFTDQEDSNLDNYASAWSLSDVTLPSGGKIHVDYEMDDYAYVQDKPAMYMTPLSGLGNSKDYSTSNQLYSSKSAPNLYFYFKRRTNLEPSNTDLKQIYFKNQDCIYYNFEVNLTGSAYEPIKGYAAIEEVGICSNDANYGYVKVKGAVPTGSSDLINPVTYTAINFARYNLPQIIYPGQNTESGSLTNIIAGLGAAFNELINVMSNPISNMVGDNKCKQVNMGHSYLRAITPNMCKKGGGQRVKSMVFNDNWNSLAGGNTQKASYGKNYDYTTEDPNTGRTISSGVASYEPQIGGDENPFRIPFQNTVQSGNKWPPMDPVQLYVEMPIGESLYPTPSVGYSKITVSSIHQQEARSAQAVDIYDFFTARDFPLVAKNTPIQVSDEHEYGFDKQMVHITSQQGYSLTFNDMHGKPKKVEKRVLQPGTSSSQLISYVQYKYHSNGNQLVNNVPVFEYDSTAAKMHLVTRQLGIDADVTLDSREKNEVTKTNNYLANVNTSPFPAIIPFPLPLPWYFQWSGKYTNLYQSAVSTKVTQQYGILDEVETYSEGAITTLKNEAFDAVTGQAILTSINNEFKDKEYSMNYPAYWAYKAMGPSYENTGYEQHFDTLKVKNYLISININDIPNLKLGDELLISYSENGINKTNNVWLTDYSSDSKNYVGKCFNGEYLDTNTNPPTPNFLIADTIQLPIANYLFGVNGGTELVNIYNYPQNTFINIRPRFKSSWSDSTILKNVTIKVIRSGAKNLLTNSIQNVLALDKMIDENDNLLDSFKNVISISAQTYTNSNLGILSQYDSSINSLTFDSLNKYVNGSIGIYKLASEYAYLKNRSYNDNSRNAGTFNVGSFWGLMNNDSSTDFYCIIQAVVNPDTSGGIVSYNGSYDPSFGPVHALHTSGFLSPVTSNYFQLIYNYYNFPNTTDPNWIVSRTVTKYSPWGPELENKDALGNYSTAQYGYNNSLPVALAQNARQQDIMAESFEDYKTLQVDGAKTKILFSPIAFMMTGTISLNDNIYSILNLTASNGMTITNAQAHTGTYSLATASNTSLPLSMSTGNGNGQVRYLPFGLTTGMKYLVSYWFRPVSPGSNINSYSTPSGTTLTSNIIEGWQQAQVVVTATASGYSVPLPSSSYVDDIRVMPYDANMVSYVYNPFTQKLVAKLDENNFATFYEYDQEGNLVRVKKETEKGIMTVNESRSANVKTLNQ